MGTRAARFRNVYGWPDWIIEVDIHVDLATGCLQAGTVRCTPPPSNRRPTGPTQDPELVARLRYAAEGRHGIPGFVSLGLPSPHKKKKDGVRLRAVTIAVMFETAREQGFSPRRVISAVYGLPVVDQPGYRTIYSPKLHRWIHQARTTTNLRTGKPYLIDDLDGNAPKRWPGSRGKHPLEPRRARPML